MKSRTLIVALTACVLSAVCSCTSAMIVDSAGSEPLGQFAPTLASVPVGVVIGFGAHVDGADGGAGVSADIDDPSVASLRPTTVPGQFVLIGLAPGQTTLHVRASGARTTNIPVQVSAQPPGP